MKSKHVTVIENVRNNYTGCARIILWDPKTGHIKRVIDKPNRILYGAADALAKLIAGEVTYKVSTMYFEFRNLTLPTDPVPAPSFDRGDGREYYDALGTSPKDDFIRVPIAISPNIESSDVEYNGNQVTFFSSTEGTAGFHGKTFNTSVNSAVYGAALVVTPDGGNQAEDIIFSRIYFDKINKESNYQIGVQWTIRFT